MLREYALSVLVVAVSSAISFVIFSHLVPINLVMIYLLGTLVVAARGHRGPAAFSSALSVLVFDFFFVPPRFSFTVHDAEYIFTFAVMFIVAMIISHLTIRLRSEAEAARQGEARTALMHEFSQNLTKARDTHEALLSALPILEKTFDAAVTTFIPQSYNRLSEKEAAVAQWVFDKGEPAGLGESSLPAERALYVPLRGASGVKGVLRLQPHSQLPFSVQQRQLLESFGHQLGLALESETERLRSSLLSSVSHDFRTPLTAIVGSASALLDREEIQKNPKISELVQTVQDEGERLSRQIQNLLEATRLESGGVRLKKELYPLEEIVGTTLERLSKTLEKRRVTVAMDQDLPPVPVDGMLVEQVLVNLLENAARHTPLESEISITAQKEGNALVVSVADRGAGLKPEELERIFDKFYHGKMSNGAGLGLAICRGIVNAHGGRIWAENKESGGAVFIFTLPLR